MRVLTAQQMQEVDAETIARVCPGLELMERAGRGVAKAVLARYGSAEDGPENSPENSPENRKSKAAIFVGPGNNGGDGLVVARLLVEAGWRCSVHLLKPAAELTPDSAKNYQRLHAIKARAGSLAEFDSTRPDWPERAREDLADATLLIDSIFGTGSTGAPRGRAAEMIALMNTRRLPIVAIDIPSGVDATTGEAPGEAVRAAQTVTIGVPKTGLLFHPGKAHTGELSVIDIGFREEIVVAHAADVYYNDEAEAARRLPARAPDLHKYDAGVLLVIAGSERYRGAALLTAEAALRAGCGMVYLAVPVEIHRAMSVVLREAITVPLPQTADGTIAPAATHALASYVERADAIAVGPGVGRHDETDAFVRELVRACGKPIVVDADGITAFAGRAAELKQAGGSVVITPHSGELARLTGETVPTTGPTRVTFTAEVARRLGVTLVHKGAPTLIAAPGGRVWINASGSSALATGGTGDVLTGLIGSLLAQASARGRGRGTGERAQPVDAACVGCFLQGRAGEIAARIRSVRGVIAGDLLVSLGPALVALETAAGA